MLVIVLQSVVSGEICLAWNQLSGIRRKHVKDCPLLIVKENFQYTLFIMTGFVNINVLDVETPISIFYNLVRQIFIFVVFTTTQSAATSTSYSRLSKMMPKRNSSHCRLIRMTQLSCSSVQQLQLVRITRDG